MLGQGIDPGGHRHRTGMGRATEAAIAQTAADVEEMLLERDDD